MRSQEDAASQQYYLRAVIEALKQLEGAADPLLPSGGDAAWMSLNGESPMLTLTEVRLAFSLHIDLPHPKPPRLVRRNGTPAESSIRDMRPACEMSPNCAVLNMSNLTAPQHVAPDYPDPHCWCAVDCCILSRVPLLSL